MPIYEFHCDQCHRESEVLLSSSDWEGTSCPHCGSTRLVKKLSVFAAAAGGDDPACHERTACERPGGACASCGGGGSHH